MDATTKFNTIHISQLAEWNSHRVPKDTIPCLRFKKVLYPLDRLDDYKGAFIYGVGWRKVNKAGTNRVDVPVYDGTLANFKDYLEKYGEHIMFYSLTGYDRNTQDCVAYRAKMEFLAITKLSSVYEDLELYQQFVAKYNRLCEAMRDKTVSTLTSLGLTDEWTLDKLRNTNDFDSHRVNEYLPRMTCSLYGIVMPPSLDVMSQEKRNLSFLNACARLKYRQSIDPTNEDAYYSDEWRNTERYKEEVDKRIDNASIHDQMFYLYGDEVGNLYSEVFGMYADKECE